MEYHWLAVARSGSHAPCNLKRFSSRQYPRHGTVARTDGPVACRERSRVIVVDGSNLSFVVVQCMARDLIRHSAGFPVVSKPKVALLAGSGNGKSPSQKRRAIGLQCLPSEATMGDVARSGLGPCLLARRLLAHCPPIRSGK